MINPGLQLKTQFEEVEEDVDDDNVKENVKKLHDAILRVEPDRIRSAYMYATATKVQAEDDIKNFIEIYNINTFVTFKQP